jgi:hypothetical protein
VIALVSALPLNCAPTRWLPAGRGKKRTAPAIACAAVPARRRLDAYRDIGQVRSAAFQGKDHLQVVRLPQRLDFKRIIVADAPARMHDRWRRQSDPGK